MTKVTIIGNSHLGALKQGWDQYPGKDASVEVTFFGAPHRIWRRMQVFDGTCFGLPPQAKAPQRARKQLKAMFGGTSVDLADCDVVVLVGQRIGAEDLAELVGGFEIDGMPGRKDGDPEVPLMTRPAFDACAEALARQVQLPSDWAGLPVPRKIIVPRPIPSIACSSSDDEKYAVWQQEGLGQFPQAWEAYATLAGKPFAKAGFELVVQPRDTFAKRGLTRAIYSAHSQRVLNDTQHDDQEFAHMNGDYGQLVMERLMSCILSADTSGNAAQAAG